MRTTRSAGAFARASWALLVAVTAAARPATTPSAPRPDPASATLPGGQPTATELKRRILLDHPLTRDALVRALRSRLRDVTDAEVAAWIAEGSLDRREIDGEERFFRSAVSNLIFRRPELEARRVEPADNPTLERAYLDNAREITAAARREGRPYVAPRRFEVVHRLTVSDGAAPPGTELRAWIPLPRRYPFQDGFTFLGGSAPDVVLGDPDSPVRAAFLHVPAATNAPTPVVIRYAYTAHGVRFDPTQADGRSADPSDPALAPFLAEEPHVVFTERIRALARSLSIPEAPPARQARAFYDWIAGHIRYSYAPEYGTVPNLSEACLERGHGDCGQEAFLFITLCRLHGIPARWQSGWSLFPGDETIHDWCEIWLSPFGWIPVDPYMGIHARQGVRTLTGAERLELEDFYFGGLSQYRLIANAAHARPLTPKKRHPRSDPVDFQRGELETPDGNLYFDVFDYALDWREVPIENAR